MDKYLATCRVEIAIIQADFILDFSAVEKFFPDVFASGYSEIVRVDPTTPKGKALDHILYRGLLAEKATVATDCLTDHFPIVSEFNLVLRRIKWLSPTRSDNGQISDRSIAITTSVKSLNRVRGEKMEF